VQSKKEPTGIQIEQEIKGLMRNAAIGDPKDDEIEKRRKKPE